MDTPVTMIRNIRMNLRNCKKPATLHNILTICKQENASHVDAWQLKFLAARNGKRVPEFGEADALAGFKWGVRMDEALFCKIAPDDIPDIGFEVNRLIDLALKVSPC